MVKGKLLYWRIRIKGFIVAVKENFQKKKKKVSGYVGWAGIGGPGLSHDGPFAGFVGLDLPARPSRQQCLAVHAVGLEAG